MNLTLLDRFPADIHPYLTEIAERLWAGHAAVMVGAGFSRNATKNDHTKGDFPNWNQLGDILYEKLHGCLPGQNQRYLNVLKLADEVQAAFGRPVLDQLIINCLPDQDHSPSPIQIKLLELPWTDIFTTNYDTLLERAGQHVVNYKYNLVFNQQDLIYSEKPRIIKLHGSLPSERPFIVSEEDYRRYPLDFAPFVNTVQQSMLENTFCLIGFSADDPNFLTWIGWVCDNLGRENAPKLYLIGLLGLTDAQKKLLTSRNIVVVNLADPKSGISHREALNNFVEFLAAQRKRDLSIGWPGTMIYHSLSNEKFDIPTIVKEWAELRKKYPNWIVFPYFEVDKLWRCTESAIMEADQILLLPGQLDIEYLFELNWRFERCLMAIFNTLQPAYEKVLEKYAGNRAVNNMWLELSFALWRYYREEGFFDNWRTLSEQLNILMVAGNEYLARYHYERCLYHITLFQLGDLKAELNAWPINETLPFWESKRAGLMAELGLINESITILERTLALVRKRSLNTNSVADYTWVSQESYIMQLLQYAKNSRDMFTFPVKPEEQTGFHDRENQLKLYKCDPWLELDHFNLQLQQEITKHKDSETKFGFGLNSVSKTYHLSRDNNYLVNAYQFLRYLEETGIPPRMPHFTYGKDNLSVALKRIAIYSPFWATTALVRSGNKEMVNHVLDREAIRDLDESKISLLTNHLLLMLRHFLNGSDTIETLRVSKLSVVLPLILSKLVVRCPPQQQRQILELILEIYKSGRQEVFEGQKELFEHLISSMNSELNLELLPLYLQFPIDPNEDRFQRAPDPFDYLHLPTEDNVQDEIVVEPDVIKNLLKRVANNGIERSRAITRLLVLMRLGQLSKDEMYSFGEILWSQTATDRFPADNNLLKFSFMNLPHPENIDPEVLYKRYILDYEPPIQSGSDKEGISMGGGALPVLQDLVSGTRDRKSHYGISWTREEHIIIFEKMLRWWAADKHYLLGDHTVAFGHSVPEEFRLRFGHLRKVLSRVLSLGEFWKEEPYQTQMYGLIQDMEKHGLTVDELIFKYRILFLTEIEVIFKRIEASLASQSDDEVLTACNTIISVTNDPDVNWDEPSFRHLIDILTDQIKWRNLRIINRSLETLLILLKEQQELFSPNNMADLLFGLHYLLLETTSGMEQLHISERLQIRKRSAALAYELYCNYKSRNESVPPVLLDWEKACYDPKEFNEIKLEWPKKGNEITVA